MCLDRKLAEKRKQKIVINGKELPWADVSSAVEWNKYQYLDWYCLPYAHICIYNIDNNIKY